MSTPNPPIKIVVTAESATAAANLNNFSVQAVNDLSALSKAAGEAAGGLKVSHQAMQQLQHVARAAAGGIMAGLSPLQILEFESVRLASVLPELGISLATLGTIAASVGVAVGAGAIGWKIYMGDVEDTTAKINEMVEALDKVPDLLVKINGLQKSGLISRAAGTEFANYLNGRTKLYRHLDGSINENPFSDQEVEDFKTLPVGGGASMQVKIGSHLEHRAGVELSQNEINDYVKNQLPKISDSQAQAVEKLKGLVEKARIESLAGLEKEKAEIHDRYEKERQEILLTAQQSGRLIGPKQLDAATVGAINNLNQAEAAAKLTAEKKAQEEIDRKDAELQKSIEAYLKDELEFEKFLKDEQKKQLELAERQLEIQAQLARTNTEVKLRGITSNPLLTASEKAQQSIGPIRELMATNDLLISQQYTLAQKTEDEAARNDYLNKANELTLEQIGLQNQLQAAIGEDSYVYQLQLAVTHLRDMNNLAHEVAQSFETVFNSAIMSVSSGITGLIMGTMTWRQFLADIPRQILTEIVGAIVQMGVRYVATRIMMATIGKALDAAGLATQLPMAAVSFAMWAPAATAASIATGGAAAVAGLSAFKAAELASVAGFEKGGYTGDGAHDEFAGYVHKGEYVVSAPAVRNIGLNNLEAMHMAARGHGGDGGDGGVSHQVGGNTRVINVFDRGSFMNELKQAGLDNVIINVVMANKTRIGIVT